MSSARGHQAARAAAGNPRAVGPGQYAMRRIVLLVLAGCATAPRPGIVVDGRSVSCRGIRIDLPASLVVRRATGSQLIAAAPDVAVAVLDATALRSPPPADRAVLIEQMTDAGPVVFRYAVRYARGCVLGAVATVPVNGDGDRLIRTVAGPHAERWLVGSPRVPRRPALTVLLDQLGELVGHRSASQS
jgi:hypothetical protein